MKNKFKRGMWFMAGVISLLYGTLSLIKGIIAPTFENHVSNLLMAILAGGVALFCSYKSKA